MTRIVFVHEDGLREILGVADLPSVPAFIVEPIQTSRGIVARSVLTQTTPHAAFYTEAK